MRVSQDGSGGGGYKKKPPANSDAGWTKRSNPVKRTAKIPKVKGKGAKKPVAMPKAKPYRASGQPGIKWDPKQRKVVTDWDVWRIGT